jgi:hypothetical protein
VFVCWHHRSRQNRACVVLLLLRWWSSCRLCPTAITAWSCSYLHHPRNVCAYGWYACAASWNAIVGQLQWRGSARRLSPLSSARRRPRTGWWGQSSSWRRTSGANQLRAAHESGRHDLGAMRVGVKKLGAGHIGGGAGRESRSWC